MELNQKAPVANLPRCFCKQQKATKKTMGLKPGQTNNPDGRPKGTPNRTTSQIKTMVQGFISDNLDDLQKEYNQLEPREKLQFIERLLKFVLPQQRDVNQTINVKDLPENEMDALINRITNPDRAEQSNEGI